MYGNLGTAHDYLGDRKAVVVYHEPHLKNVQVLGDMSGEGTACGYLGNVYYCLEYFKRAKDYCEHHQDQIKKWCGEIFAILIVVLSFVVLYSVVLCFCTPLVLSFVLLLLLWLWLSECTKHQEIFFTRKRKDKRIHPYK